MKEQSMNYCCDCEWAVKKGLIFKTWYCTNPEKNEGFGSHIFHPVTCMPVIKTPIDCDTARFVGKGLLVEQYAVNLKHPCPNYKGQLRGHPAIPPMKNHLPCPPRPERVAKAMEEHDAAYLMNQKQKELEAENKLLKEDIKRMVTTLKHHCNHFITLKLCDCFTNRMGSRGCVYKRSDGCDIADFINKYDGKDGEK